MISQLPLMDVALVAPGKVSPPPVENPDVQQVGCVAQSTKLVPRSNASFRKGVFVITSFSPLENLIPERVKSDAASSIARHRCDVSSELRCRGAKPRRNPATRDTLRRNTASVMKSEFLQLLSQNHVSQHCYHKRH